jgi:hypothetical protein
MPRPDFFGGGVMPEIHRLYAEMKDALDDDFVVKFPDWIMGPFGVACQLRGFDRILMDFVLNPGFAERILRFVVGARKSWQRECDRFLGTGRTRGVLGNDDVNCPTMSPSHYREILLPLEIELSESYGGISYWHSCGNTTRLLDAIACIPNLDLFHCGPWTDVSSACRIMGKQSVAVEICIEPVDQVQSASPAVQKRHLEDTIAQIPVDTACYIKVDSLEVIRDLPTELEAIQSWLRVARTVLG